MPELRPAELHIWQLPSARAEDAFAIADRVGPDPLALIYAPNACLLQPAAVGMRVPQAAYELRLFGTTGEVRWVEGQGAVLLADAVIEPSDGWRRDDPVEAIHTLDRTYLMWGTVDKTRDPARTLLVDFRIEPLDVSFFAAAEQGDRLVLRVREYLAPDDPYGNVAVVAERLVGMERHGGKEHA